MKKKMRSIFVCAICEKIHPITLVIPVNILNIKPADKSVGLICGYCAGATLEAIKNQFIRKLR